MDKASADFSNLKALDAHARTQLVGKVFDDVAQRYNVANDVLSFFAHRMWKRATIGVLNPPKTSRKWKLLDCASGSGDLAFECIRRGGPNVSVVASDINSAMLAQGMNRWHESNVAPSFMGFPKPANLGDSADTRSDRVQFVTANSEQLPFADRTFDAVTIGFGVRNLSRVEMGLAEMHRVLKPGGKLVCLEFSRVQLPAFKGIWEVYAKRVLPIVGGMITGHRESYEYLTQSIEQFADITEFPCYIERANFRNVDAVPLSGGIAVIYSGWRACA